MDEARLAEEYRQKHSTCDIQQHPWQAVFGAGVEAGYRSALADLDALRAENTRLVSALKEIADFDDSDDDPYYSSACVLSNMARNALEANSRD